VRLAASAVVTLLFAALVVLAVANRAPVVLILNPVAGAGGPTVTLPLYAIVFAALAVGVVLGGTAVALSRGRRNVRPRGDHRARRGRWRGRDRTAPMPAAPSLPPPAVRARARKDR
jgi:hypothetical protein